MSKPPKTYFDFVARFPGLGEAWDRVRDAEESGPLDARTARLIKLAIAVGAMREGAVHSATRKALDQGASRQELDQIVALAASVLGFPSTVAIFTWMRDVLEPDQ